MAKRALLFGVDLYPPPADDLRAAAKEAKNWERILLAEFGFDKVTCLTDSDATREAVLRELRLLFGNAGSGDDVIVGFFGHGAKARGWKSDTETNDEAEHALIAYAGDHEQPVTTLQHAAVTPSDFARILVEKRTPADVRVALALDCCFAEKFAGNMYEAAPPARPQLLFIPGAVPSVPDTAARTFHSLKAMVSDPEIADPIILGASRFDEPAHEVGLDDDRRLLFSSKLEQAVETAFPTDITYAGAIKAINPLSDVQSAIVGGNQALEGAVFAGGFARQVGIFQPAIDAAAKMTIDAATTTTAVGALYIRLLGLLTLVNLPVVETSKYRSRLVAPYDDQAATENDRHLAFIEVADRDMNPLPELPPDRHYVRGGIMYSRWQLTRHRVTFVNAANPGTAMERSDAFKRHVPSLPIVTPTLDKNAARAQAYERNPLANVFTAFFDFQSGSIGVDPRDLEKHRTHFTLRYTPQTRTWGPEYTPISALVTAPVAASYAVINIEDVVTGKAIALFVNSGATITIGNARELDINGPGSGEGPREHFLICYKLAPEEPRNPGLPATVQVPINACTVTSWP